MKKLRMFLANLGHHRPLYPLVTPPMASCTWRPIFAPSLTWTSNW